MNTACQAARSECELLFSVWEALPNLAPIILAISAIIAFGIYRQNQHQGRLNNKHAKERVQIARSFDHIVEQTKDRDLLLANEQFKALIEALKEKHSGPYGYEEVENTFVNFRGQAVYGSEILIRLFNYYEATAIGIDPRPLVVAVMIAASASFATPIGYQTNMLVYGPGGYRFTDFLKVGVPLNLSMGILTSALIPLIWPL